MFQQYNNLNNLIIEKEENLSKSNSLNKSNISFFNQFKSAFSLVELSIVLIIIGLLISAVIGGRALIDEAKIITIRNEFEEMKNALYQYYLAGHSFESPNWPDYNLCHTQIFEDIVDMGYIDKSKYIIHGWSAIKSKIKGINGAGFLLWNNPSCHDKTSWNYGYDTNKEAKTFLNYGATALGKDFDVDGFLSPQFCDKLVKKLRSFYKEDVTQPSTQYSPKKVNKYMFYCECHAKVNGEPWGLGCGSLEEYKKNYDVQDIGAHLVSVIFDF